MAINVGTYNQERQRLVDAGSKSAAKAHVLHGTDSVPDRYGQTLVDEAQMDEEKLKNEGKLQEANRLREAIRLVKNNFGFYPKE